MKHTPTLLLLTLATAPLTASTITPGDVAAGGIGYAQQVTLGGTDSATIQGHVGAWSWEDEGVFTPGVDAPVGWTHTSNWIALTVTANTYVSLSMTSSATVPFEGSGNIGGFADTSFMYPSFTLWQNWDNDDGDEHIYPNTGNVPWAEDLVYLGHVRNNSASSASQTWFLPAGQYTLALGSDAPSSTNPPRQGYSAAFTSSPVPEPSAPVLSALLAAATLLRRRR